MVEGARLESVFTGDRNAGSNPALSASIAARRLVLLSKRLPRYLVPACFPHDFAAPALCGKMVLRPFRTLRLDRIDS